MKCANCAGTMRYDVASYGLVCDSCGSIKRLHRPEEGVIVGMMDFASALRGSGTNWGVTRRLVTCKSCGAQMLYDSDQMSGMCPFCGSAVVLSAEEADCGIAPNAIIPFSITKEQVVKRFYRWNKFAFWSPEKFRRGKVLGNLTPLYIPYWTFDADTVTSYSGRFGYTRGSGDSERTVWYQKTGIAEKHISNYTVCGSRKFFNDTLLKSAASFSPKELIPYTPEVLSGMAAEIYTIGIDEAWKYAADIGLKKEIMDSTRQNEHADCYSDLRYSTEFYNVKFRYVLIPVWLSGCRYGGRIYNVAASGYNGTGHCRRPFSIAKLIIFLLLAAAYVIAGRMTGHISLFTTLGIAALVAAMVIYVIMFIVTLSNQRQEDEGAAPPQAQ